MSFSILYQFILYFYLIQLMLILLFHYVFLNVILYDLWVLFLILQFMYWDERVNDFYQNIFYQEYLFLPSCFQSCFKIVHTLDSRFLISSSNYLVDIIYYLLSSYSTLAGGEIRTFSFKWSNKIITHSICLHWTCSERCLLFESFL